MSKCLGEKWVSGGILIELSASPKISSSGWLETKKANTLTQCYVISSSDLQRTNAHYAKEEKKKQSPIELDS